LGIMHLAGGLTGLLRAEMSHVGHADVTRARMSPETAARIVGHR